MSKTLVALLGCLQDLPVPPGCLLGVSCVFPACPDASRCLLTAAPLLFTLRLCSLFFILRSLLFILFSVLFTFYSFLLTLYPLLFLLLFALCSFLFTFNSSLFSLCYLLFILYVFHFTSFYVLRFTLCPGCVLDASRAGQKLFGVWRRGHLCYLPPAQKRQSLTARMKYTSKLCVPPQHYNATSTQTRQPCHHNANTTSTRNFM